MLNVNSKKSLCSIHVTKFPPGKLPMSSHVAYKKMICYRNNSCLITYLNSSVTRVSISQCHIYFKKGLHVMECKG